MTPEVVVLGSLHLDIMVEAPRQPRRGETLAGTAWAPRPGGKGGNQAVEAARHGARTAMVGRVGEDEFGRRLLDHLAAAGVDASAVLPTPGIGSGMSVAIVEGGGDYAAVIVSGANLRLGEADLAAAAPLLREARLLLLQNEVPEAANLAAAHACGRARVLLDAAPARPLPPELCRRLDLLVANATEAEQLAGQPVADLATATLAAGRLLDLAPATIVTAGSAGLALAARDGLRLALPAHPVPVAGTHGAGDTFVGALAARLAAGDALPDAAAYANAAAALAVATPPARLRPTPADVARLLASGGPPPG